MATMFNIKHKMFLLTLLLFAFPAAKAMGVQEVVNFCKETSDVDFCSIYIGTDIRRVAARNLNDVLLIVIAQCEIQVINAGKEINGVRHKFSGPIGKERIWFCERNYKYAYDLFKEAWELAHDKTFAYKAYISVLIGSNYMRDCEEEFKTRGRPQKSPVTFYNTNVAKLTSIARKIIDKLPILPKPPKL